MSTQNVTQSVYQYTDKKPSYSFLARPPPPQKKRPTQPLPATPVQPPPSPIIRRRSNTYSSIASWAAHVQPGSPGSPAPRSPCSPRRRPSVTSSRRPSLTRINRRSSITHSRAPSGSFANVIDTTPSVKDFNVDLTTLGYTSLFVHLPKTPSTPARFLQRTLASKPLTPSGDAHAFANIPIPPIPASPPPPKTVKRFRSLSILRSRTRSKSTSAMPASPTKSIGSRAKAEICAVTIAKRKKAKYAYMRPAPLANELALMQFADGGSMDTHVKRVMENQARAAAGYGAPMGGVGDVFRDGKGGIWWDQDEEWEYAHLLGGETQGETAGDEMQWVSFDPEAEEEKQGGADLAIAVLAGEDRRGSVSTQDSDLDSKYIMQPAEEQQPDDDLAAFGSALTALTRRKPGMSVLSIPARPRRTAKHLRKPEFMIDIAAFGPRSPRSPKFGPASPIVGSFTSKPKGKARRRPAPLKLSPLTPGLKRPSNSPMDAERVRRDFLDASFTPAPVSSPLTPLVDMAPPPSPAPSMRARMQHKMSSSALREGGSMKVRKQPSRLNMRSLFGKRD